MAVIPFLDAARLNRRGIESTAASFRASHTLESVMLKTMSGTFLTVFVAHHFQPSSRRQLYGLKLLQVGLTNEVLGLVEALDRVSED